MSAVAEQVVVNSHTVDASREAMLEVDSPGWDAAEVAAVGLEPTALDRQPSAYVRRAWQDRRRGDCATVEVSSLTGAEHLAVRLVWDAPRASRRISDINVHPDACAVLFPVDGVNLAHDTMGSEEHPVQAWHWRAGTDEAFVVTATGVGTTQRHAEHAVEVSAAWDRGRWRVVFTRALQGDGPVFTRRARMPVAFAVWSGVAGERAGLKSVSQSVGSLVVGG